MRILVTGGAGFIGSALVRHLIGRTDHSVFNIDKLTYAASQDSLARGRRQSALLVPRLRYRRCQSGRRGVPDFSSRCGRASRRRDACRPLHRRAGALCRDQRRRHAAAARGGARLLAGARAGGAREFPLPARLHRRGFWRALRLPSPPSPSGATTIRARPIRRARRRPITSRAPGHTPTACPSSSPIRPTTTGRTTFPKSSSR